MKSLPNILWLIPPPGVAIFVICSATDSSYFVVPPLPLSYDFRGGHEVKKVGVNVN